MKLLTGLPCVAFGLLVAAGPLVAQAAPTQTATFAPPAPADPPFCGPEPKPVLINVGQAAPSGLAVTLISGSVLPGGNGVPTPFGLLLLDPASPLFTSLAAYTLDSNGAASLRLAIPEGTYSVPMQTFVLDPSLSTGQATNLSSVSFGVRHALTSARKIAATVNDDGPGDVTVKVCGQVNDFVEIKLKTGLSGSYQVLASGTVNQSNDPHLTLYALAPSGFFKSSSPFFHVLEVWINGSLFQTVWC